MRGTFGSPLRIGTGGGGGEPAEVTWKATTRSANLNAAGYDIRVALFAGLLIITGIATTAKEVKASELLFTLPVGARPEKVQFVPVGERTINGIVSAEVLVNGEVQSRGTIAAASEIGFSCVVPLKG